MAAAANALAERFQRGRQRHAAQEIQLQPGVLLHQLHQGWHQLLMPGQKVGGAGAGHHQTQPAAALAELPNLGLAPGGLQGCWNQVGPELHGDGWDAPGVPVALPAFGQF